MVTYVQYGSGFCAPSGWLNFDASPTLKLERLPMVGALLRKNNQRFPATVRAGNIIAGLPVPDGSAAGVYASHILEHMSREDCFRSLANSFRMLAPGGVFRLIVPDLEWRAKRYLSSVDKSDAADIFFASLGVQTAQPKGLLKKIIAIFGNSNHLWMWDERTMRAALAEAGFHSIRRAEMGDSGDPMFDLVEDRNRFFDDGSEPELAMHAIR